MNGRIYDGLLGRFLSADPFLARDTRLDGFNRYAYALNNPFRYVDPSGYKNFTRADGTIDSSAVHSFTDFVDLMLTDFPAAVYNGVKSIPGKIVDESREKRAEAYTAMREGDGTAPVNYYAYSAFEFTGGMAEQVATLPEKTYALFSNLLRGSGAVGQENKMEATFERELAGTEARLFMSEVKERPLDFLESLVSAKPFEITAGQTPVEKIVGNSAGFLSFDTDNKQLGGTIKWSGGSADGELRVQNPIGLDTAGSLSFGAGPRTLAFQMELGKSVGGGTSTIVGAIYLAGGLAELGENQRKQLSEALGVNIGMVKTDNGNYLVLWKKLEEEKEKEKSR